MSLANIYGYLRPWITNRCVPFPRKYCIKCGVKQADVISPLFWTAGVEYALPQWKLRIHQCGWDVGTDRPLTNVRYADDLIIYRCQKKSVELFLMLEPLVGEVALEVLNWNAKENKKIDD